MVAGIGELKGVGEERRSFKACHHCKVAKRCCGNLRPCLPCCTRGLECKEAEKGETCLHCKERRVKCDKQRPCGRCSSHGLECQPWLQIAGARVKPVERPHDDVPLEVVVSGASDSSQGRRNKRPRPSLDLLDACETALIRSGSVNQDQTSTGPVPRNASFFFAGPSAHAAVLFSPENPLPFTDGPIPGWSQIVPPMGVANPWPRSLVYLFKFFRVRTEVFERVLSNMPPKLFSTIISVCRGIDALPSKPPPVNPACDSKDWQFQSARSFRDSTRVAVHSARFDLNYQVISGMHANQCWADYAGGHLEEFVSRSFNGDLSPSSTELRMVCGYFYYVYRRRKWMRDSDEGMLLRLSVTGMFPSSPEEWAYTKATFVEVTPEEFEAARAVNPGACEGYMIPVTGSKSAVELLHPRLCQEESFAFLNSHEAGRRVLDRLADKIERDFAFVFEALQLLGCPWPHRPEAPSVCHYSMGDA